MAAMRVFPRARLVVHRPGNELPDATGEIDVRRVKRARTEPGPLALAEVRLAEGTSRVVVGNTKPET